MAQVPNPLPPHRELRTAIYVYSALIVVGIVIIILLAPWIGTWEPVASARASDNLLTLIVFTAVAVPVFMFVMVFGFSNLYFFRHRHYAPDPPARDGPHIIAGLRPQIAWIALTAAHALVLFLWGVLFLARADAAPAPGISQLNIDVTAEQWQFNFTYPQYNNAQSVTLEVPVDRPIYFTITSIDVVHSFSVNELGFKEDAVPGVFTHIRVTPNKIGNYTIRCYELCGLYHTYMEGQVKVVPASEFTLWVNSLQTHGYPWGINGAGAPVGAPAPPTTPTPSGGSGFVRPGGSPSARIPAPLAENVPRALSA
jgi:cytochrome c oxidase subunit 2